MKKGWEIKKLGDICEFKSGATIDNKLEKNYWDNETNEILASLNKMLNG